jgi:GntR family transcriptional repressor for pyruvate dehydrogenase complex
MAEIVRRTSTAEAIVEHLLERIRLGEYGPGDRLPSERKMQGELGVGRLSLREGLARLSALGVIRVDHGKGAYVCDAIDTAAIGNTLIPLIAQRNAKSMRDLIETRIVLEAELAARAAQRRTDRDLQRLEALLDEPGPALTNDQALADLDLAFHGEVARIAGNEFLQVIREALAAQIRAFLVHFARAQSDHAEAIANHRPILEAIRDGDAELARQMATEHIHSCTASVENYLGKPLTRSPETAEAVSTG